MVQNLLGRKNGETHIINTNILWDMANVTKSPLDLLGKLERISEQ